MLCMLVCGLLTACDLTPPPATPVPAPVPLATPLVLTGTDAAQNTPPFTLAGGNYTLAWSAVNTQTSGAACLLADELKPVDPASLAFEQIGGVRVTTQDAGQTIAYNLPAGAYYLKNLSTCQWTVTVTPLP